MKKGWRNRPKKYNSIVGSQEHSGNAKKMQLLAEQRTLTDRIEVPESQAVAFKKSPRSRANVSQKTPINMWIFTFYEE